jgi:hypothetical protein
MRRVLKKTRSIRGCGSRGASRRVRGGDERRAGGLPPALRREAAVGRLDEASEQVAGAVVQPLPPGPGQPERFDHEYVRNGTANGSLMSEPLSGWRPVAVRERRTAQDFAEVLPWLVHARIRQVAAERAADDLGGLFLDHFLDGWRKRRQDRGAVEDACPRPSATGRRPGSRGRSWPWPGSSCPCPGDRPPPRRTTNHRTRALKPASSSGEIQAEMEEESRAGEAGLTMFSLAVGPPAAAETAPGSLGVFPAACGARERSRVGLRPHRGSPGPPH